MFRCMDCGNEEKFMGMVREEGRAFIYQNGSLSGNDKRGSIEAIQAENDFNWAYIISDKDYNVSHRIEKCAVCNSYNIRYI